MKYFNKTRTIEDKVNNRDLLRILQEQNQLLKQILVCLEGNQKQNNAIAHFGWLTVFTVVFLRLMEVGSKKGRDKKPSFTAQYSF